MTTQPRVETWETVSRKAYRDRDIPLDKWREKVSQGHPSYLPGAVAALTVVEFVHFYGAERFRCDWPALRAALPSSAAARHTGMYDLAWSQLVGGGWNLKPAADFYAMPARRREFLVQVAHTPGKSTYELARALGMQYRRAHDHFRNLVDAGKIRAIESIEGGRRKLKLFPAYARPPAGDH